MVKNSIVYPGDDNNNLGFRTIQDSLLKIIMTGGFTGAGYLGVGGGGG